MVQTNTVKGPGKLDSSVIRVKQSGVGLSMSSDCNPRYCYIDPFGGAVAAVMESGRNVAMSGATPKAITDCLNYGNPENPEIMWQFAKGCEGIKEACKSLNTPVVSGNVSLYNETDGEGIFPTPAIVMVGVLDDANKSLPSSFQKEDSSIYIIGETYSDFGGSLLLKEIFDEVKGELPKIDYEKELKLWKLVRKSNEKNLLNSAKDVNVGGIALSLAKMSIVSSLGIDVECKLDKEINLFSESFSRAILEVNNNKEFEKIADNIGIKYQKIGVVTGDKFKLNDIERNIGTLEDNYFNSFEKLIESDL
jgi:phosphoribosylformylglycinamidine synthase